MSATRKILFSILAIGLSQWLSAQAPDWAWSKRIGSYHNVAYPNGESAKAVVCDRDANIYLTGLFYDTAHFDNWPLISQGKSDIFLAKFDANGNAIWAVNAGGESSDAGGALAIDKNDRLIVCGYYKDSANFGNYFLSDTGQNMFVAFYDMNSGQCLQVRRIGKIIPTYYTGSTQNKLNSIYIDKEGNYFLDGFAGQMIDLGGQSWIGSFMAKYDSLFNLIWVSGVSPYDTIGGPGGIYTESSAFVDSSGDCFLVGNFAGQIISQYQILTNDSFLNHNGYLVKFESDQGNFQWYRKEGGIYTAITSITGKNGNSLYGAGYYYNSCYFDDSMSFIHSSNSQAGFLFKKDYDGNMIWEKDLWGFSENQQNITLASENQQSITVGDNTNGNVTFMSGNFYNQSIPGGYMTYQLETEFDKDGNQLWIRLDSNKTNFYNTFYTLMSAVDVAGNFIVCGSITGDAVFGSDTLTAQGSEDIFIAKLGNNSVSAINDKGFKSIGVKIFPNPNSGSFTLSYKLDDLDQNFSLQITDLSGNILAVHALDQKLNSVKVNEELPAGYYFAKLLNNNRLVGTSKFIEVK